ncbi:MAG: SAM-dependent chlorinase/fluorinase [Elusimicrobia bacterium]|nr:SAM-dependent chlorinase/fluorinase [Elusimicrobiota bacterium]
MLIALLTDFGLSDPFVGLMKAVILTRRPDATIVDLAHGIAPQDVRQAAFALMHSLDYFAEKTLFVCVVDPGVGSDRRILWARGTRHQFIAPDNGLLSWVEEREKIHELRSVTNRKLFRDPVSPVFHGRDIVAPVAAALAGGAQPDTLGPRVPGMVRFPFPVPRKSRGTVKGEVLVFDRFGNAITNLRPGDLPRGARFKHKGKDLGRLRTHYAEARPGRALALTGSSGYIELSVRDGSFASQAEASVGDPVVVEPA